MLSFTLFIMFILLLVIVAYSYISNNRTNIDLSEVVATGLIDEKTAVKINQHFANKKPSYSLTGVFFTIGCLFIAGGVIAFIFYKWQYLGRLGYFATLAGIIIISLIAAALLRSHHQRFLSEFGCLFASLTFGSALVVAKYIYNLSGYTSELLLIWLTATMVIGVFIPSQMAIIVGFAVTIIWTIHDAVYYQQLINPYFILFWVTVNIYAYYMHWPRLMLSSILFLIIWLFITAVTLAINADSGIMVFPPIVIGVAMAGALMMTPQWLMKNDRDKTINDFIYYLHNAGFVLIVFSFAVFLISTFDRPPVKSWFLSPIAYQMSGTAIKYYSVYWDGFIILALIVITAAAIRRRRYPLSLTLALPLLIICPFGFVFAYFNYQFIEIQFITELIREPKELIFLYEWFRRIVFLLVVIWSLTYAFKLNEWFLISTSIFAALFFIISSLRLNVYFGIRNLSSILIVSGIVLVGIAVWHYYRNNSARAEVPHDI